MHDFFCLDDRLNNSFTFGVADQLPLWLAKDPEKTISNFCSLHTKALTAKPSTAQNIIAEMWRRGHIKQIFSDNVDNMLAKVKVPFERTRGSGVFNERHPTEFKTKTLLVVGVAADRREIIKQARSRRMNVIVVDPCGRVSHGVQHHNFIKAKDHFVRLTANDYFKHATKLSRQTEIV
jgi:hypothetical protein